MTGFLLDTNICIYFIKGKYNLANRIETVDPDAIFISEITLAELKFGVANSANPSRNQVVLEDFIRGVRVLPIIEGLDIYANEKTRLRRLGTPIDEFDLLIGSTAIFYDLTLVTRNVRHFERLKGIRIEDWTCP